MNQQPGRFVYMLWCLAVTLLILLEHLFRPLVRIFRRPPKGPQATIAGQRWRYSWNWRWSTGRALRALVRTKLAEPLDRNVIIHVGNGDKSGVIEDGNFHLHLWCNPGGERFRNVPETIWGFSVTDRDEALAPTGQGALVCDPSGWDVAELIGDGNLFVHHNVMRNGSEAELALLERLLNEALEIVRVPAAERAERMRKRQTDRRALSRKALIDRYLDPRFLEKVRNLRAGIEKELQGIGADERKLFSASREITERERELGELRELEARRTERFSVDFDKIRQIKDVLSIDWEDGKIVILTDTLYANDPRSGTRHLIGRFRIEIFLDGQHGGVLFHNLTHKVDGWEPGMNAPHVLPTGRPCTGNTQELFPKLIGSNQIGQLAMLAVRFPQSVNANDKAGKFIDRWPKA